MEYLEFQKKCGELGLHIHDNLAIGVYKEYPLSVTRFFTGMMEICCYLTADDWEKVQERLEHSSVNRQAALIYEENRMAWKIRNCEYGKLLSDMNEIVNILSDSQIEVSHRCALCGREETDAHAMIAGTNRPIHKKCIQKKLVNTRLEIEEKSYKKGIIGAVIGCFLGSLPNLWVYLFWGQTYAVLFLLLPLCIYYGYKFLGGRMDRMVVVVTIILSILSVFCMEIAYLVNYNIQEQFVPDTLFWRFKMLIKVFQIDGLFKYILKNSSLKLLFVFVGIIIEWEVISKNVKQMEKNIEEIMDTVN